MKEWGQTRERMEEHLNVATNFAAARGWTRSCWKSKNHKPAEETHKKSLANFPYPNQIKLISRERQKEIKGEYLNAELMHQRVVLPISDIKPDGNIESEIFPPERVRPLAVMAAADFGR